MKILRSGLAVFLLMQLTVSWTPSIVHGQDYEDPNKKVLKEALLGAGTGAIASGTSGGNAGKGALIGAGTNVIGNAALDMLTTPSAQPQPQPQPQPQVYVQPVSDPGYARVEGPRRHTGGCGRNG